MKLTLGKKLAGGYGIILALMVFSAATTYFLSAAIRRSQDVAFDTGVPSLEASRRMQRDLNQTGNRGRQVMLAGQDAAPREAALKQYHDAWDGLTKDVADLETAAPRWPRQEDRDRLSSIKSRLSGLRSTQESAMKRASGRERDALTLASNQFTAQASSISDEVRKELGDLATAFAVQLEQEQLDLKSRDRTLNLTMSLTTLLALGIGIVVAVKLVREITAATQSVIAQGEAIGRSNAVIEFLMDGTIVTANENFLAAMGYTLSEIQGKHHSMFVDEASRQSGEYREFWNRLNRGEYQAGEYKRMGQGGREVWLQASYNPTLDAAGRPFKVVKYATDITKQKLANADYAGQIAAIGKSQTVIEFKMDGTVITANDNFLKTFGYMLDEIKGRHHSLFVDESARQDPDYKEFWAHLNRGEYQSGDFKRIAKGGKEVWIQASYNPILDLNGKPFKVVKYATDITTQVTTMHEVATAAVTLSSAAEQLTAVSQQMSANAEETSAQATVVTKASEQVNRNLQTVATGTEEMGASIKEIAKNATESAKIAMGAVKIAETTTTTVAKLGDSSTEIGQVIEVITSIAQQTNLLALNATIEAARAGEAGKGFAVVANEVKELAKETAKATEDISRKIETIQTDTKAAVDAIGSISEVINQINGISNTIATAVEEQDATTNEMARNVSEAARGSGEITSNVAGVAEAAASTSRGASDTQQAARELVETSRRLHDLVGKFDIGGTSANKTKSRSGATAKSSAARAS